MRGLIAVWLAVALSLSPIRESRHGGPPSPNNGGASAIGIRSESGHDVPALQAAMQSAYVAVWRPHYWGMGGRSAAARRPLRLGIAGTRFTVDGKPTFLLGISYYAALGASPNTVGKDLDRMRRFGFNWIRVWADWSSFGDNVSAVDSSGHPREPYLGNLRRLVEECGRRGMVVDVTLTRGDGRNGSPQLQGMAAHLAAVETLVSALKQLGNWYFDIANERNIGDARHVSIEDLRALRDTVKRLDPGRLVTASHGGDVDYEDLRRYTIAAGLDFICPHRPRDSGSAAQTESIVRGWLAELARLGHPVPIHLQEPFRRGYMDWRPSAEDYVTDLRGAIAGGAAGWCFHNGGQRGTPDSRPRRSFDLHDHSLFDQLDAEERRLLPLISAAARSR
jgi:hypothetical protein